MAYEVKKARSLDWDDTEKIIRMVSGSESVRAGVIVHRAQTVTISDPVSGKVLTLSPEDYVTLS